MYYTLITGSSQGMGKEMAIKCASLGRNILLVSLPNENLANTTSDIGEKYNVKADYLEIDLTKIDSPKNILDWVKHNNYKVNFLINNAGFGGVGPFEDYSFEYINLMLDLNIKATTNLTHFFVPELKKNAPSHLLCNASMIANFPCPYKSLYAATKTYIKSFTRAIREELKPHNVKVSVLQPGATPTNEIVRNQIKSGGFFAKISVTDVKSVAEKAIVKTLKGQAIIIPGLKNRISLKAVKLFPMPLLQKILASNTKSMNQ
jgi:uncharacterized protein